ncbi:MAG: MFS transporter [Sphingobium sp.]
MGEGNRSAAVRPWAPWYGLCVLVLLYFTSMIDRTIIAMLIGPIKADLGLGDFQASLLMGTAFGVCYVLFALPFGWAADRFSKPHVIAFGILFWSIACAGGGFASSFAGLFVSRMLVGAGEAALSPCAYSMMAGWFPRARLSLAMAIYHYGGSVGGALALVIGGAIAHLAEDGGGLGLAWLDGFRPWQVAFLIVGLPGIALALLALTLHEPGTTATAGSRMATAPAPRLRPFLAAHPRLTLAHLTAFSLTLLVVYGVSFWAPQLFIREQGWSALETGSVLGGVNMAGTLAGQVAGVTLISWLDRRGHADAALRAFAYALGFGLASTILAFATSSPVALLTGYFLLSACLHPVMTYGSSALQLFTPAALRGRMSALFLSVTSLMGLGAGPACVGFLTQYAFSGTGALRHALFAVSMIALWAALALVLIALAPYRRALHDRQREAEGDIPPDHVRPPVPEGAAVRAGYA